MNNNFIRITNWLARGMIIINNRMWLKDQGRGIIYLIDQFLELY